MALLDLYDKVTEYIKAGKYTVGVYIDLQKAFDTIDHSTLLVKLQNYGITGKALNWFTNYLKIGSNLLLLQMFNSKINS